MAIALERTVDEAGIAIVGGRAGSIRFGFTERTGGVSRPPFQSLNLGSHVGDDPVAVGENRRRALRALGADSFASRLLVPNQVHGDRFVTIRSAAPAAIARARAEIAAGADGIVCTAPGIPVMLCYADCVPVILTCGDAFAVVHSGWKGTIKRIAASAARSLAEETSAPVCEVSAYIGPHIRGSEYEVSAELMDRFAGEFAAVRPARDAGSRLLDLAACIREALADEGILDGNVADSGLSTMGNNDRFFSYRAERGRCGRHGAVAVRFA